MTVSLVPYLFAFAAGFACACLCADLRSAWHAYRSVSVQLANVEA